MLNMNVNLNELLEKVVGELEVGLPFMDGRTKSTLITETELTINNLGFLKGDNGEYAVITFKEDDQQFYFGGSVVTEKLKKITSILGESQDEFLKQGLLKVKFVTKTSDKNRMYIDFDIVK